MSSVISYASGAVIGNSLFGVVDIVTSPGTSTLTASSAGQLQVTGTDATYNVDLPDARTLIRSGQCFEIKNDSSVTVVTVKDGGGTAIFTLRPKIRLFATCVDITSAAGQWSFDVNTAFPKRLCTNGVPGNNAGTARYTAAAAATTQDLYGGPISCHGTFTLTLPPATTLHNDLTTILGGAPPPGLHFQAAIFSSSGTQSFATNTGVTWRGPSSGAGANYTGQLWVQYESPTAYWVLNMRDY